MNTDVRLEGFHAVKHALRFAPGLVDQIRVRDVAFARTLAERLAPDVVEVLLDHPRSPGNAGAVVRVAAAAGASGVAMVGSLDPWHPTVLRGSAGLHFALPVLAVEINSLAGPFVVLDADGDPSAALPCDVVLVVGSERSGVGAALRERADLVLALPMRPGVSSLNLATATAAALYRRSPEVTDHASLAIAGDDPRRHDVRALLDHHRAFVHEHSPSQDVHALDLEGLLLPAITFVSARQTRGLLLAVGALQHLEPGHVELTSMHTAANTRGRGVGRAMLAHLLEVARARGCTRVSLETGSMAAFAPARSLYLRAGFRPCPPYADHVDSPSSAFFTLDIS